jgi:FMN phosphatase YigB (HAD superfamily)
MNSFNRLILVLSLSIAGFILIAVAPIKTQEIEKQSNKDVHVIFDLNGVLVKTSSATKVLGSQKFMKLALVKLLNLQNPLSMRAGLKKRLFHFLNSIEPRNANEVHACDDDGNLLPQVICNYLKGTESSESLRQKVDAAEKAEPVGLEISIVASVARMIFTPEQFCQIQEWVPGAIEFVKELKADGCKVYILSNWDAESFELFKEQHAEKFVLFDGIFISGSVGLMKPDHKVYEVLFNTFGINKSRAIFFDDQIKNVQAALEIGLKSGLCKQKIGMLGSKSPNINDLKNQYHQWRYHEDHGNAQSNQIATV